MSEPAPAAVKAVYALWKPDSGSADVLAKSLVDGLAAGLADAGASRVQVNVSDAAGESAILRLTPFPAPVDAPPVAAAL